MKVSVLLLAALLGVAAAASSLRTAAFHDDVYLHAQSDAKAAFLRWARFYGKSYTPAEEPARFEAWMRNVERISRHRSENSGSSYTLGLNGHADLTTEEFRLRYFGESPKDLLALRAAASNDLEGKKSKYYRPWQYGSTVPPAAVDWVAENMITPVKDQHVNGSKCGCCFAFSGVAGVEAVNALYSGGDLTTLSEQQIVDCDSYDWGCDGGDFNDVFRYTIDNGGLVPDAEYPYAAKEMKCLRKLERKRAAVTIDHIVTVPESNETALAQALAHTPTNVAMCCGEFIDAWHLYTGGIFDEKAHCTEPIDHALLAVGYGTDPDGTQFWKIKNSWGAHWGEEGYMRVKRNIADPKGSNAVALLPGFAVKLTDNPRPDAAIVGRKGAATPFLRAASE